MALNVDIVWMNRLGCHNCDAGLLLPHVRPEEGSQLVELAQKNIGY